MARLCRLACRLRVALCGVEHELTPAHVSVRQLGPCDAEAGIGADSCLEVPDRLR
jgi:hypothetical protein